MQIHIDPEFRALIPPQTDDESAALEASLLDEGCRDALVIWQGHNTLIDGHHRYEICQRHNLPFNAVERAFDSREDVIVWMVQNQLARRNITAFARGELALRMKDAIAAKGKSKQLSTLKQNDDSAVFQNFGKREIHTDKEIAKVASVSHETIRKIEMVSSSAPESIKERARSGELSVDRAYKLTKALQNAPIHISYTVDKYGVEEVKTVEILKRLHDDKRDSFEEIERSGYVYASDTVYAHITDEPEQIEHVIERRAENHRRIAAEARKYQRETAPADLPAKDERYTLLTGDLATVLPTLGAGSVDCIITDPPYPQEYIPLYGTLAKEAARLLKPGGSLVVMCGQSYFPEVLAQMTPHIRYQWLLEYRTPGEHFRMFPRKVHCFWKPVVWFVNGEYNGEWVADQIKSDANDKRFHKWGQSENGIAELVQKFSAAGETILDPFLGGGTTGLVSLALNRKFIGVDVDADCVEVSRERIIESLE